VRQMPRKQPPLEKFIVAQIVAELRKYPGVVVRKRHGTVMGKAGDPDLYGTIRGKHFEIEVKRPGAPCSQLTPLQTERLREWRIEGGAIVGVAHNAAEALAILGLVKHEPVWTCTGCHNYCWRGEEAPERCPLCGHRHFDREAA